MLTVLLLAGVEKLINLAIASDEITKKGLLPLSGNVLRLNMATPKLSLDVMFNEEHIRFEPVTTSLFESESNTPDSMDNIDPERISQQQRHAGMGHALPDCTINVANPADLFNLIRAPEGNLPIEGDYKILMHLKQLMAGFDPDIASQLEPIIGASLAGQIETFLEQLKGSCKHTAKNTFEDMSDFANDIAERSAPDIDLKTEASDLKQQLLKLRADVEREEARLAMIKAEQAALK